MRTLHQEIEDWSQMVYCSSLKKSVPTQIPTCIEGNCMNNCSAEILLADAFTFPDALKAADMFIV